MNPLVLDRWTATKYRDNSFLTRGSEQNLEPWWSSQTSQPNPKNIGPAKACGSIESPNQGSCPHTTSATLSRLYIMIYIIYLSKVLCKRDVEECSTKWKAVLRHRRESDCESDTYGIPWFSIVSIILTLQNCNFGVSAVSPSYQARSAIDSGPVVRKRILPEVLPRHCGCGGRTSRCRGFCGFPSHQIPSYPKNVIKHTIFFHRIHMETNW